MAWLFLTWKKELSSTTKLATMKGSSLKPMAHSECLQNLDRLMNFISRASYALLSMEMGSAPITSSPPMWTTSSPSLPAATSTLPTERNLESNLLIPWWWSSLRPMIFLLRRLQRSTNTPTSPPMKRTASTPSTIWITLWAMKPTKSLSLT